MKERGMVHIYYGTGKGKTTCAIGLAIRAAGAGNKVIIYQFMKNNSGNERKILNEIECITVEDGLEKEKFSFQMTEQEKKSRKQFYERQFFTIIEKAILQNYDMLILDEILYAIKTELLEEKLLLEFLERKPEKLEVVLTGNKPSPLLLEKADYVSEIKKRKHPMKKECQLEEELNFKLIRECISLEKYLVS